MTMDIQTKFVVLTTQRSGSTWLMSTLNNLENVTAQGELFLPRKRVSEKRWDSDFAYPRFIEEKPKGLSFRPFSVFSYLRALYRKPGAVGFKLMYAHLLSYPEISAFLIRHRIRTVHLVRQNHLDVVISGAVKAKIGKAHLLTGQPDVDDLRVLLNTETLIPRLSRLERKQKIARKLLRWCRLPHIEVSYEDLLRDPSNFNVIWDFLAVNPERKAPESNLVKIRRKGYSDTIINYHEVKIVLANSAFAELIE